MINKVLATILYISGLFDSKSIVKEVVWRKNIIRGGRLLIQGGDYIYIYIYVYTYHIMHYYNTYIHKYINKQINIIIYIYIYIYIYVYMYVYIYIYIHIHIYVYVCIHIYIYIERERESDRSIGGLHEAEEVTVRGAGLVHERVVLAAADPHVPRLRTNGVNANGAAAKVMTFDRFGKKVSPGTFGNI